MITISDWVGRVDDIKIEYEPSVVKAPMLPRNVSFGENLTVIDSIPNECYDDIYGASVIEWDDSVAKADRYDYLLAICSGTIAGAIDVFYVGQFSLGRAKEWGSSEINQFVLKIAELQGFKGEDLSDAIQYLEKKYKFAADGVTSEYGGGLQHHLRDFSHHFSLGGLMCSIYTQFSGKVIGTDTLGTLKIVELDNSELIGKNFEEKLLFGIIIWFFHMVSDMAGSNATAGKGTGIPGPILSIIKELSAIPCFKDKKIGEYEFHLWVSKLFNGTLLGKHDENGKIVEPLRFDLRTEIGILNETGRQCIPVLINECIVRGLYFIRRLYNATREIEIYSIEDLKHINRSSLLPFNNKIIKRMVTIACGAFTAIDMTDAAIRASITSSGFNQEFSVTFFVHINIVEIGRFIIACLADSKIVTEDIREAKEKRDKIAKQYEKLLSDFKCLSLNYKQMRALLSLERIIVQQDIDIDSTNYVAKKSWKREWEKQMLEMLYIDSSKPENYFFSLQELSLFIDESQAAPWIYLMALEALCFVPYFPLTCDDEKNGKNIKLKCKTQFLTKDFVNYQGKLNQGDFVALQKAYRDAKYTLTGAKTTAFIFSSITAAIAGWTGTWYWFSTSEQLFRIAYPDYKGDELVGFGLMAFFGGLFPEENLIITEATLLGMALNSKGSENLAVYPIINDSYIFSECCKILTFCKEVLILRFNDVHSVQNIKNTISSRAIAIEKQCEALQSSVHYEKNKNKKMEIKTKIKVAKKSLKYLNRTIDELEKDLAHQEKQKDQTKDAE